jgi:hypothetical protein
MGTVLTVGFKFSVVLQGMIAKCHFESLLIKGIRNMMIILKKIA